VPFKVDLIRAKYSPKRPVIKGFFGMQALPAGAK